jgi:two-component system, OmpR family, response regulator
MFKEALVKILVVEDDEDVRSAISRALREDGFGVESVADGVEGLYHALNWEFDAIVLDVMLPGMDGWELLRRLRREKATPVLMLTAKGELEDRLQGLNSGADDYLSKPYEPAELIARLRALVRRASGLADNRINLGRVAIDTSSQTITRDGEPVQLTPGQYKIVEYLGRRAGKLVSRDALCDALLIEEDDAISNVLTVQIYNIRKKLGKEFLQNRRGSGYIIPKA